MSQENMMISHSKFIFLEHEDYTYPGRTLENVKKADITLLISIDSGSPGTRLTKRYVKQEKKQLVEVDFMELLTNRKAWYSTVMKKMALALVLSKGPVSVNVAGNGLDKFFKQLNMGQRALDRVLAPELMKVFISIPRIARIRSGGQSGIDETGLKAGIMAAAKCDHIDKIICLAPGRWRYRTETGKDIYDDKDGFIQRFVPFIEYYKRERKIDGTTSTI